MRKIDLVLENSFVQAKINVDEHALTLDPNSPNATEADWTELKNLVAEQEERLRKLVGHRWMEQQFADLDTQEALDNPNDLLKSFMESTRGKAFEKHEAGQDRDALMYYLETEIIDQFYKKSLGLVDPDSFELKYINKQ